MSTFLKVMTILAKAVADRVLGVDRTDQLVAALQEYRAAPSPPEAVPAAALEGVPLEERDEFGTLLTASGIQDVLTDPTLPPGKAAERLLEQFPDREGSYLIWLDAPPLEGRPCFVHFSWQNRAGGTERPFSVRDYVNGRFLFGHHKQVPKADAVLTRVTEWKGRAAEVWAMSRKRQKCTARDATSFPTTEGSRWRQFLEEMTRTQAP